MYNSDEVAVAKALSAEDFELPEDLKLWHFEIDDDYGHSSINVESAH